MAKLYVYFCIVTFLALARGYDAQDTATPTVPEATEQTETVTDSYDTMWRGDHEDIIKHYPPGQEGADLLAAHREGVILEESWNYTSLEKCGEFEIREYVSGYIVSTAVGDVENSEDRQAAFRRLAGYIGVMGEPQNDRNEKIEMTVPVGFTNDETWFYLPSRFSPEGGDEKAPPTPSDPLVSVSPLEALTVATITYQGDFEPLSTRRQYAHKLLEFLSLGGINVPTSGGGWYSTSYNPPWTRNDLRTNEIHLTLKEYTEPVCNGFQTITYLGSEYPRDESHMIGVVEEETPDYTLAFQSSKGYEIREYADDIIVRSSVEFDDNTPSSESFNDAYFAVVGYLGQGRVSTAENNRGEQIDMTAPVGMSDDEVFLFLPSKYSVDILPPIPTNPRVTVTQLAPRKIAVLAYPGNPHSDAVFRQAKGDELLKMLSEDNVPYNAEMLYTALYNPPWTPEEFKLNEAHVVLPSEAKIDV